VARALKTEGALAVLLPSFLFGAATRVDGFLVLFHRQDSGEPFLSAFSRNFEFFPALLFAAAVAAGGLALALVLGRISGRSLPGIAPPFATLLVPCGLTAASVLSVLISPSYPYGLGLASTLNLEGPFKEILTAGLFGAGLVRSFPAREFPGNWRWLSPVVLAGAFLVFTLGTPRNFYQEGEGQGNMFKYLRMARTMAGTGTLDIERAEENADPTLGNFLMRAPEIAAAFARESKELLGAIAGAAARGEIYTGEMTARMANRSMFRSAEGGIYYINAPGPGILLVPAVLLDSALNRAFGENGQLAAIAFWQFLAALLVLEMFLCAREIAGALAALLTAAAAAVIVPLFFYSFQIYPELPAALFLLFAFRKLVLDRNPTAAGTLAASLALAFLPWLHQKYSVPAFALGLIGVSRFLHRRPGRFALEPGKLALFIVPLVLSAYSVFLYNHALTGSLSPTATFTAAARTSFAPEGLARGLLGLLLDRENGLFVFAPFYLLSLAGLAAISERHRALAGPLAAVVVSYLLVIASFPYWPGAVSTMGRYLSSVLPLLILPIALVTRRSFEDGIVAGVSIALSASSLAMSASFVRDLVPSWQPQLLWDRVLYCDPAQYLPNFVSEGILGSGPAHLPKLLAQILAVAALALVIGERTLERVERPRFSRDLVKGAGALLLAIIALASVLERFPGNPPASGKPSFRDTRSPSPGRSLSVQGEHGFEGEGVWVPGKGTTGFQILSKEELPTIALSFTNGPEENGVEVRERESQPFVLDLPPKGPHQRTIPLRNPYRFDGPRGRRFLYLFEVSSRGSFIPAEVDGGGDERPLGTYVTVR
jgi:hypothetical protein